MQGGGAGEKEERALKLFRGLSKTERKIFLLFGWAIFRSAWKAGIILADKQKSVEVVELN